MIYIKQNILPTVIMLDKESFAISLAGRVVIYFCIQE